MSHSEYKTKITRQRSRTATKPYARNSTNLVSKVKEWLTPSSWLSYLSPTKDPDAGPSRRTNELAHSSLVQDYSRTHLFHSSSANDDLSSDTMTTEDTATPTDFVPMSTATNHSEKKRLNAAQLRATLSMFEEVLGDNREVASRQEVADTQEATHQEVADTREAINVSISSSNESWVAEDTEAIESDTPQLSTDDSVETPPTQQTLVGGDQSVGVATVLNPSRVGGSEHTVQLVSNPVFFSGKASSPLSGGGTVKVAQKVTPGFSPELSRRLYSSSALVTSTPQLSPVHELQEEDMQASVEGSTSPFQPVLPLSITLDHRAAASSSVSGHTTPARAYTSESISRSPFRSPFYSGRTSFGGAAAYQKMRVKRPRTESSPPVLPPLRVSVRATPKTSSNQSVVTQSAKRIMDTLNSLASPLSDARKMPMRGLPPEMQQAKRRRVSNDTSSSILSPPPITPLRSTKSQTLQIVPSERPSPRTSLATTSMDHTDGSSSISQSSSTVTPTKPTPKITTPSFSLVSTNHAPFVLSGLKFSAPPLLGLQASPEQNSSSPPLFSGKSPQAAPSRMKSKHAGGKMSRRPRASRNRRPSEAEEEEEYINPVAPPPKVGLSVGLGGSLPSFTFHSQLMSDKGPTPPKQLVGSKLPSQQIPSATPSFSFSKPVPINAESAVATGTPPKTSYGFSAPKLNLSTSTAPITPQPTFSAILPASSRPAFTLVQQPPSKTLSTRPSLRGTSVVDALRKPEYNQFLKSTGPLGTSVRSRDIVDLTNSDDEAVPARKASSSPLKPLSQFAPSAGSWSCGECFVSNKASDGKCVACSADKPGSTGTFKTGVLQLESTGGRKSGGSSLKLSTGSVATSDPIARRVGPPPGSWECSTCLVSNKPSDDKCVACSSAKPSDSKTAGPSSAPSAQAPKSRLSAFPALAVPASDSWTCETCLVPNKAQDTKCVACSTAKPGAEPPKSAAASNTSLSLSNARGLKLSGGISLGGGSKSGIGGAGVPSSDGGFKLGAGISLGGATSSDGGFKLGAQVSLGGVSSSGEGFKLGAGVSLGGSQLKPLPSSVSSKDSWSCGTCMVVNKHDATMCVACSASKSGQASTTLTSGTFGGFGVGGSSLSMPKTSTASASDSTTDESGSAAAQWTCSTCLISNKADASVCMACSASKPDGQLGAVKKDGSKPGLQFGSAGGLKTGAGLAFGTLSGTSSSLTSFFATSSTSEATGKDASASRLALKPPPTLQVGDSSTSTSGLKLTGPLFPDNKQAGDSPLMGIKFGGAGTQSVSNPPTGIKLGTVAFGSSSLNTSSSQSTVVTSNLLGGINFGGAANNSGFTLSGSSGGPVARGDATAVTSSGPSAGIKLGGTLAMTSSSNPLAGIKLGASLGSESSTGSGTLSLGQVVMTTASNNPLAGIKLGAPTFSNSPLAGIKLGGNGTSTSTAGSLSSGATQPQAPGLLFGTTIPSLGTFNFSGAQQTVVTSQASSLQFPTTTASVSSMFAGNTSTNPVPKFAPSFGVPPGPLSLGTPAAGESGQAEMQSPDNEMNVEQDKLEQPSMPSVMFGVTKQQTGSNVFTGQTNPTQTTSGFSFGTSGTAGTFNVNTTKPSFNFGASPASSFTFTGSTQNQPTGGSGSMFAPAQPNPSLGGNPGFNFSANSGMNLTLAPTQPNSQAASLSAASSSSTPRVIKKARRRNIK